VAVDAVAAAMVVAGFGPGGATPAFASASHTAAGLVAKLTGVDSMNDTYNRWDIKGTDLGIMWDNGAGQVLTVFGDTFGADWVGPGGGTFGAGTPYWRSNVLVRSSDTNLSDGMTFDSAVTDSHGLARELIPGVHNEAAGEVTKIPTAGISIGSRQYMSYMSVKHWGDPGMWDTNYASIAYSDDNGNTWVTTGTPTWSNPTLTDNFQMQSFVRSGGYLYVFGTPSGRGGSAYVARVPEASVLTMSAYQYWNGSTWVSSESSAAPVVGAPVSELSVQYNAYSGKFLMMYLQGEDIILRTATGPTGGWSDPQVVVSSADYPGLYGGFMHPWNSGGTIYFTLSQWDPYNVYLMKYQIDANAQITNPNLIGDPSFERKALNSTGTGGFWAGT